MATITSKPRKPSKPQAPDVCRLSLFIRGEAYAVRILTTQPRAGVVRLVRLRKADSTAYHVARAADGSTHCDCADATFRERECKHQRATAAVGLI
jgi:hypothetical protein